MDSQQIEIFRRLQTQAKEQSSQLGLLQQQVESKERESRKLRIVQAQVNEVLKEDPKTVMYEGVGKMFVMEDPKIITKSLRRKENEAIEDVGTLTRKFKYVEKELKGTKSSLAEFYARLEKA